MDQEGSGAKGSRSTLHDSAVSSSLEFAVCVFLRRGFSLVFFSNHHLSFAEDLHMFNKALYTKPTIASRLSAFLHKLQPLEKFDYKRIFNDPSMQECVGTETQETRRFLHELFRRLHQQKMVDSDPNSMWMTERMALKDLTIQVGTTMENMAMNLPTIKLIKPAKGDVTEDDRNMIEGDVCYELEENDGPIRIQDFYDNLRPDSDLKKIPAPKFFYVVFKELREQEAIFLNPFEVQGQKSKNEKHNEEYEDEEEDDDLEEDDNETEKEPDASKLNNALVHSETDMTVGNIIASQGGQSVSSSVSPPRNPIASQSVSPSVSPPGNPEASRMASSSADSTGKREATPMPPPQNPPAKKIRIYSCNVFVFSSAEIAETLAQSIVLPTKYLIVKPAIVKGLQKKFSDALGGWVYHLMPWNSDVQMMKEREEIPLSDCATMETDCPWNTVHEAIEAFVLRECPAFVLQAKMRELLESKIRPCCSAWKFVIW